MKTLLLLCLAVCCVGCSALNHPSCRLPGTDHVSLPAHPKPYRPEPWGTGDQAFPYSVWTPHAPRSVKAVVILVPGWDGTMRDYEVLAEHLRAHGYAVYGSEQRTGVYDPVKSQRGNPDDWQNWVRDLQGFTAFVRHKHPGVPFYYHGHSFGTMVAAQTAAQSSGTGRPAGIILQSMAMPFLIEKENAFKGALFGAFAWVRVPQLALGDLAKLGPTGDPTLNCQWMHSEDRLAEGYKVRYFLEAAKLGHRVWETSEKLTLPVLALEGEQDNVVAPKPADKWAYDQFLRYHLRGGRAEVIRYHDGYHTMTIPPAGNPALDRTTAKALGDITHWLDRQTSGSKR